jgi:hypothetical protein
MHAHAPSHTPARLCQACRVKAQPHIR